MNERQKFYDRNQRFVTARGVRFERIGQSTCRWRNVETHGSLTATTYTDLIGASYLYLKHRQSCMQ